MGKLSNHRERIAVVGAGVAGLGAAWSLAKTYQVTLVEKNAHLGGHAHTADIHDGERDVAVDTGFIVYNPPNYPFLSRLFEHLDVATVSTNMSFGVSRDGGRLEYAGTNLNGLFAQRRNVLRPRFWRMVQDIKRFYASAPSYLTTCNEDVSIGELLSVQNYSEAFVEDHLMPMAAAIWSASRDDIARYPADAFIRFFANHGLLNLTRRPLWHTVRGGSREYVSRMVDDANFEVLTNAAISHIKRSGDGVVLHFDNGSERAFDHLVIATHADEALSLLGDPTSDECEVLGTFKYSENQAVLHRDPRLMPRRKAAWSSWNYIQEPGSEDPAAALCVSYWMNRLQDLSTSRDIFVTLNPVETPKPELTWGEYAYTHPIFSNETATAQLDSLKLQGNRRTWFCGSYLGHGFHEDALQSGLWVAQQLGGTLPWADTIEYTRVPQTYLDPIRRAA